MDFSTVSQQLLCTDPEHGREQNDKGHVIRVHDRPVWVAQLGLPVHLKCFGALGLQYHGTETVYKTDGER